MENELRDFVSAGKNVTAKIEVGYPAGVGRRPSFYFTKRRNQIRQYPMAFKGISYYLLISGKSPVEKFLKNDSYASIFARWILIQILAICLIFSNETIDFIKIAFFHAVGPSNTDKGRDFAFFMAAIIAIILTTIASIGRAFQIKRQREREKRDWVEPSEL